MCSPAPAGPTSESPEQRARSNKLPHAYARADARTHRHRRKRLSHGDNRYVHLYISGCERARPHKHTQAHARARSRCALPLASALLLLLRLASSAATTASWTSDADSISRCDSMMHTQTAANAKRNSGSCCVGCVRRMLYDGDGDCSTGGEYVWCVLSVWVVRCFIRNDSLSIILSLLRLEWQSA